MATPESLFEGNIVIISFTECDKYDEATACLVYRVAQGLLVPLLGVMDLPSGLSWRDQYHDALAVIRQTGCTEVYTPYYIDARTPFFGQMFGFVSLSEPENDEGVIEEWCEFGSFLYSWEMLQLLEEHQIAVRHIDPITMRVIAENK